ncbi:MAG: chromosomal replication initiator protein DnaA [Pseudomonadota bacterium]
MQNQLNNQNNLENTSKIITILHKNFIDTFGQTEYQNWLKELKIYKNSETEYTISTTSPLIYNKITTKYNEFIQYIFKSHNYKISIKLEQKIEKKNTPQEKLTKQYHEIFSNTFNPLFTFEQFVHGPSNEFAYHSAKTLTNNIINNKNRNHLNPLYICGPVGLGKTHLLHSIAQEIIKHKKIKIIYVSAEKFMYEFIKSLRNKNISDFKETLRSIDILLFDDVQFLHNKTQTLNEFEQTFDALLSLNKTIILSADRPPKDLEINNRMKSRLLGGLVADIGHSNYELRYSILKSKLQNLNIDIHDDILKYLSQNITTNIRELEGSLHKVIEYQKILNHDITIEQVKNILHRSIKNNKNITLEYIVTTIAKYFKINKANIISHDRSRNITRIRQIAMHLCRLYTGESLTNIGNYFSGRGHTAVIHAGNNINKLIMSNASVDNDINHLKDLIQVS